MGIFTGGGIMMSGIFPGYIAPPYSASGGTITYADGYTIHTFTSSGTFTVEGSVDIDYLIVGGGSAGRTPGLDYVGGGGGGGQVKELTNKTITTGTYTVTIGAGGAAGKVAEGSTSSISTINSAVGGKATNSNPLVGNINHHTGRESGDGLNGAGGFAYPGYLGGGGGGSQTAGGSPSANTTSATAGHGGQGKLSAITSIRYGGGGGGGKATSDGNAGLGVDGGGNGGNHTFGQNAFGEDAAPNRGGGGGGGCGSSTTRGGNGGSGIVVIRYKTPV